MIWLISNGSDSTGFYFYSSLIQVKAAIFSIYGVFIIFKIQICNQNIETCKNLIVASSVDSIIHMVTAFDQKTIEAKEKWISENPTNRRIHLYQKWLGNEKFINGITTGFTKPMFLLVVGMVIDAVALLLQQFINKILWIEIILYGVILFLFIWSLILVYHSIKDIVLTK